MDKLKSLYKSFLQLKKLLLYRNIKEDGIVREFSNLISILSTDKENSQDLTRDNFYTLYGKLLEIAEKRKYFGHVWQNYLFDLIISDENIFTVMSEKSGRSCSENLKQAAIHDLNILKQLFMYDINDIGEISGENINFLSDFCPTSHYTVKPPYLSEFSNLKSLFREKGNKNAEELVYKLINYYYLFGAGKMAHYTTFRWSKGQLKGIKYPDPVKFTDLIGYETQKKQLITNTDAFIRDKEANNVLLFGDSGTGKSSSVKALVNKYSKEGLRLIEIDKQQISDLPEILQFLKERGLYYIIFMDDLSFADFETGYKYLKALMEGGVEVKPDNVLFYATSNRRHLIKEKWGDRNGENREIHITDAIQEKFSLSDRFGLTINYQSPGKKEFLNIVRGLAKKYNIKISSDKLEKKALIWEKRHKSMSGRSARQFINYLLGEEK